uniref:Uncharacterized protein n=1 Tax=Babesia bovis TaxID=5865 RepID=S6BE77_BABBO|nr:hypothetical protein [Babesia bovis]
MYNPPRVLVVVPHQQILLYSKLIVTLYIPSDTDDASLSDLYYIRQCFGTLPLSRLLNVTLHGNVYRLTRHTRQSAGMSSDSGAVSLSVYSSR